MPQQPSTTATPPGAEPPNAPQPKWTIMIYLAGDNNLSANSIEILKDLEDAFPDGQPNEEIRVIACFDPNTPRPRGARYVEINHRRHNGRNGHNKQNRIPHWGLHNDLVPSGDGGDRSVSAPNFSKNGDTSVLIPAEPIAEVGLSRFLEYALANHKADGYMLILFGHGGLVAGNTFLVDNNPPSFLRLKTFANILSKYFSVKGDADDKGNPKPALDILACDNCMMNGIETAYQIKDSVRYVLGSQGLMLAVGWQFRKIIEKIIQREDKGARSVADAVCEACARGLLDFALMDRSSDQSLLDLSTLGSGDNIVTAVRQLSKDLQDGLDFDDDGIVIYPAIRDAVKLARLDAQSYFDETFVDLYDFCLLLLKKCNAALAQPIKISLELSGPNGEEPAANEEEKQTELRVAKRKELLKAPVMELFGRIATSCQNVLNAIKSLDANGKLQGKFVLSSYYIGPDLQYSNGVSIYFPWTLPDGPTIFEPVEETREGGVNANGGRPAATVATPSNTPKNYWLKTPFDEYKNYDFAKPEGGDWTKFLEAFFRATLRNVRRSDYRYVEDPNVEQGFLKVQPVTAEQFGEAEMDVAPEVDLHKSSSDMGSATDETPPLRIKNYPRRHYLSPSDIKLRDCANGPPKDGLPCVSYLGWNLRGLVATQVGLQPNERADIDLDESPTSPNGGPNGHPQEMPAGTPETVVAENQ